MVFWEHIVLHDGQIVKYTCYQDYLFDFCFVNNINTQIQFGKSSFDIPRAHFFACLSEDRALLKSLCCSCVDGVAMQGEDPTLNCIGSICRQVVSYLLTFVIPYLRHRREHLRKQKTCIMYVSRPTYSHIGES